VRDRPTHCETSDGGSAIGKAELIAFRVAHHGVAKRLADQFSADRLDPLDFPLSINNRDVEVDAVVLVLAVRDLLEAENWARPIDQNRGVVSGVRPSFASRSISAWSYGRTA
jgi:hypothetical protein